MLLVHALLQEQRPSLSVGALDHQEVHRTVVQGERKEQQEACLLSAETTRRHRRKELECAGPKQKAAKVRCAVQHVNFKELRQLQRAETNGDCARPIRDHPHEEEETQGC